MRVFISGAAGHIGKHLVKELHNRGHQLFVGDLKPRPKDFPFSVQYRTGDLNDLTYDEFADFYPEVVIHLAATFERLKESINFFESSYSNNTKLSHHMLELVKKTLSARKYLFASSYLVYKQEDFLTDSKEIIKLNETSPIFPRNLIGSSKFFHENELSYFQRSGECKIEMSSLRIFRGYDYGDNCIISRWSQAIAKGHEVFVYGKDNMFDYISAEESAYLIASLSEIDHIPSEINIGTGEQTKIEDILNEFIKISENEVHIINENSNTYYERSVADLALLNSLLPKRKSFPSLLENIPKFLDYAFKSESLDLEIKPSKLLLTSASAKTTLIKSIRFSIDKYFPNIEVVAGDSNYFARSRMLEKTSIHSPTWSDLGDVELIEFLKAYNIKFIVPSSDQDIEYFSKKKDLLYKNNLYVMVSSPTVVLLCQDKLKFYETFQEKFPIIETSKSIYDFSCEKFVVKEQFGAGSKRMLVDVERETAISYSGILKSPIFQPYYLGPEYTVDAYLGDEPSKVRTIVRRRFEVRDGESKVSFIESSRNDISKLALSLGREIGASGHINIQIIDSPSGLKIVECNPRVGGGSSASILAGLDSIPWFISECENWDIPHLTENIELGYGYYIKYEREAHLRYWH